LLQASFLPTGLAVSPSFGESLGGGRAAAWAPPYPQSPFHAQTSMRADQEYLARRSGAPSSFNPPSYPMSNQQMYWQEEAFGETFGQSLATQGPQQPPAGRAESFTESLNRGPTPAYYQMYAGGPAQPAANALGPKELEGESLAESLIRRSRSGVPATGAAAPRARADNPPLRGGGQPSFAAELVVPNNELPGETLAESLIRRSRGGGMPAASDTAPNYPYPSYAVEGAVKAARAPAFAPGLMRTTSLYDEYMARRELGAGHAESFAESITRLRPEHAPQRPRRQPVWGNEGAAAQVQVPPPTLTTDLLGMLTQNGSHSDVAVVALYGEAEPVTFAAHASVLSLRSPVFRQQLEAAQREGNGMRTITVRNTPPRVLKALLHFLYTDDFEQVKAALDEDDGASRRRWRLQAVLAAAHEYQVARLLRWCEQQLCEHISGDAVCFLLQLAHQYEAAALEQNCLNFIRANMAQVVVKPEFAALPAALLVKVHMHSAGVESPESRKMKRDADGEQMYGEQMYRRM